MSTPQKSSAELLTEWSKWLISINFLSATGCVVALKTSAAVSDMVGRFFFLGILSFGASMLVATLLVLLIARSRTEAEQSIPHGWMAMLQWLFFVLGVLFVLLWIAKASRILS